MSIKFNLKPSFRLAAFYHYSKENAKPVNKYQITKWIRRYVSKASSSPSYQSVVGLEIHAQINCKSKMFSSAGFQFSAPPNSTVSSFDAALPGTLPVLNRRCVEAGILTALALNCEVHTFSTFDRKHYFYADLPAGFQITQQRNPFATNGYLDFITYNVAIQRGPTPCKARIKQIQLEQDSGKSLHDDENEQSLIDLNRAGVGLMEIVFEPDLTDGEEAASLIKELILILKRLGTCSCEMQEGALRVDANISVCQPGQQLGVRTEVKNLNSIRAVVNAIDYEIQRQIDVLKSGREVLNETRTFDPKIKETVLMRDKESLQDYRFMPEPNLPPLCLRDDKDEIDSTPVINIDSLRRSLPKLPKDDRQNLMNEYGLTLEQTMIVMNMDGLKEYFEKIMKKPGRNSKIVYNGLFTIIQRHLKERNLTFSDNPVHAEYAGDVLDLIQKGIINSSVADRIIGLYFDGERKQPKEITEANGWAVITDEKKLEKICQNVIKSNPSMVKKYRKGKSRGESSLVLKVQEATNFCSDSQIVRKLLNKLI